MPLRSNLNAAAEQFSSHDLSCGLPPVVHWATHPVLGRLTRSHGAALDAREEPWQKRVKEVPHG